MVPFFLFFDGKIDGFDGRIDGLCFWYSEERFRALTKSHQKLLLITLTFRRAYTAAQGGEKSLSFMAMMAMMALMAIIDA